LDIGVPLIMYAFLNPMLTDCLWDVVGHSV
jgi:hypothetical protein